MKRTKFWRDKEKNKNLSCIKPEDQSGQEVSKALFAHESKSFLLCIGQHFEATTGGGHTAF